MRQYALNQAYRPTRLQGEATGPRPRFINSSALLVRFPALPGRFSIKRITGHGHRCGFLPQPDSSRVVPRPEPRTARPEDQTLVAIRIVKASLIEADPF